MGKIVAMPMPDVLSDLRGIARLRGEITEYRSKVIAYAASILERSASTFKYYITDLHTGDVVGTDSTQIAYSYLGSSDYSVIEAVTGLRVKSRNNFVAVLKANLHKKEIANISLGSLDTTSLTCTMGR